MGNPQAGQIVDNIFASFQQAPLGADETGKTGDILVRKSANSKYWITADSAAITANAQRFGGIIIARADFDTTGQADGASNVEFMDAPSYAQIRAGGAMNFKDLFKLNSAATTNFAIGQTAVKAASSDIANRDVHGMYVRRAIDSRNGAACESEDIIIVKLGVLA